MAPAPGTASSKDNAIRGQVWLSQASVSFPAEERCRRAHQRAAGCCSGARRRAGHRRVLQRRRPAGGRTGVPHRDWGLASPLSAALHRQKQLLWKTASRFCPAQSVPRSPVSSGAQRRLSQDLPTAQTASPGGGSVFRVSERIRAHAAWSQTQALVLPQPDPGWVTPSHRGQHPRLPGQSGLTTEGSGGHCVLRPSRGQPTPSPARPAPSCAATAAGDTLLPEPMVPAHAFAVGGLWGHPTRGSSPAASPCSQVPQSRWHAALAAATTLLSVSPTCRALRPDGSIREDDAQKPWCYKLSSPGGELRRRRPWSFLPTGSQFLRVKFHSCSFTALCKSPQGLYSIEHFFNLKDIFRKRS